MRERDTDLGAGVGGRRIDDYFENFAKLAKVLALLERLEIGQPRRQAHHEHQILLHYAHVGQMTTILCQLLLLLYLFLSPLFLDSDNS